MSTYSGTVSPDRYLDKPWQAGQVSRSTIEVLADGSQQLRSEARIEGEALPARVGNGAPIIAAGALTRTVRPCELAIGVGQQLTSADVAAWLQDNIDDQQLPLTVTLSNEIRVGADDLSLANGNLTINGVIVNGPDPIDSLEQLAQVVNNASAETGVEAYKDFDGTLVLRNVGADRQGEPIVFGAEPVYSLHLVA